MLPESENQTEQDLSSTSSEQQVSTGTETPEQPVQVAEPLDLDSVEKFRFQGREWTPKDFTAGVMMQADYTRKTQEMAQERKYSENLSYDLEKVAQNPNLISEFKKIYPEKYHSYLRFLGGQSNQPKTEGGGSADTQLLSRLEKVEQQFHQRQIEAIEAELENLTSKYSKKYPMADEEAVMARAQVLHERGETLNDKAWESLWKQVNDRNEALFKSRYSQQVKQQTQANAKGKDVASGGGIPGTAPKNPKTVREAGEMLRQSLEQQG